MVTIPKFLLTDTVTVETLKGHGGRGAIFETSEEVRVRVDYKRRVIRNPAGVDVISDATLEADPSDAAKFTPESKVTIDGRAMKVLSVAQPRLLTNKPVMVEVLLG
jgi:hypothetical protein